MYEHVHDFILNRTKEGPYGLVSHNNAWIMSHGINVYLRISKRLIDGQLQDVVDVGNLESENPGSGQLPLVFDDIEYAVRLSPYRYLYVENVHNERLRGWLERRGFEVFGGRQSMELAPSYLKEFEG